MSSTSIGELLANKGVKVVNIDNKKTVHQSSQQPIPAPPVHPGLKRPSIPKVGVVIQTDDERKQTLEEFKADTAAILTSMYDHIASIRKIEAMSPEESRIYGSELRKLQQGVTQMLGYDEPYKTPAVIAFADAMLRTCPAERPKVEKTLERLVEHNFLGIVAERGNRTVYAYGKDYVLANGLEKSSEARNIFALIPDLVRQAVNAGRELFFEELRQLQNTAGEQIDVSELKPGGKDGRIILPVPDRKFETQFQGNGYLLISVETGRIRVIDGIGGISRVARELAEARTFIHVSQLQGERISLNDRVPSDAFQHILDLFKLLKRGIPAAQEEKRRLEAKAEFKNRCNAERLMSKDATVSKQEWLLEGKVGLGFIDNGTGFFEQRSGGDAKKIWQIFALFERNETGQIRVARFPERLAEFFADYTEFQEPGEKFSRLSHVGIILRMAYTNTRNDRTDKSTAVVDGDSTI